MPVTKEEIEIITGAIEAAELRTSGEIVCVVSRSSSDYNFFPLIWAVLVALATPSPLIILTRLSVQRIYIIQLLVFLACLVLLSLPRIRMWLVPRKIARTRAHRAAMEQFMIRGMSHTRDRTGILIFVSLAERYARIIADEGIARQVPQARWNQAVAQLTQQAASGALAEGLAEAIQNCGDILAGPFPRRADNINELPDRLFII
jgi:putative membrane protein